MTPIQFFVPGNPQALKRHRTFRGKSGHNINVDPSAPDKADFLAKCMEHRPQAPLTEALSVTLHFDFQRPNSHFKGNNPANERRDNMPYFVTRRPDVDNLVKFVLDALNGVFFKDDAQVVTLAVFKRYADFRPGVSVDIELANERYSRTVDNAEEWKSDGLSKAIKKQEMGKA